MCELFALSSSLPTEASFSLNEFSRHGGLTDMHKDGWGIAYYDQNDAQIIKEPDCASDSAYLRFVRDHSIRSHLIISHIRLATHGERSVRNSQPFARELGGKLHTFAHNGDLENSDFLLKTAKKRNRAAANGVCFRPIGSTDSEQAFCYLLSRMQAIWQNNTLPTLQQRQQIVADFAREIRPLGIANFLYSDSDYLFIHSHRRTSPKDPQHCLPGLYLLHRTCPLENPEVGIEGLELSEEGAQSVLIVASVPLSAEQWEPLPEGEIRVLRHGKLIATL